MLKLSRRNIYAITDNEPLFGPSGSLGRAKLSTRLASLKWLLHKDRILTGAGSHSSSTSMAAPPTATSVAPPAATTSAQSQSGGGGPTSSPLLFFVALGFGVVFTNLWYVTDSVMQSPPPNSNIHWRCAGSSLVSNIAFGTIRETDALSTTKMGSR